MFPGYQINVVIMAEDIHTYLISIGDLLFPSPVDLDKALEVTVANGLWVEVRSITSRMSN